MAYIISEERYQLLKAVEKALNGGSDALVKHGREGHAVYEMKLKKIQKEYPQS